MPLVIGSGKYSVVGPFYRAPEKREPFRPTHCVRCGKELPLEFQFPAAGRPHLYCSLRCKEYNAKENAISTPNQWVRIMPRDPKVQPRDICDWCLRPISQERFRSGQPIKYCGINCAHKANRWTALGNSMFDVPAMHAGEPIIKRGSKRPKIGQVAS